MYISKDNADKLSGYKKAELFWGNYQKYLKFSLYNAILLYNF